ncbi:MAG: hypothetical protein HUU50_02370 [Candidatus Brocadiae bacterium]|nr:hypothetical protein [Candidatus Brocadiia bacterium]
MKNKVDFIFILEILFILWPISLYGESDFIRVYMKDRMIFEAPVKEVYTKKLSVNTSYRIALFRVITKTPAIILSSGDIYENVGINLGVSPSITLGEKNNDSNLREAILQGRVASEEGISYQYILLKTFRNLQPYRDVVPGQFGGFRISLASVPANYSLVVYKKEKEETFQLKSKETRIFGKIHLLGETEKTMLLQFKNQNLSEILDVFAEKTGIAFLIDDSLNSVDGKGLNQIITIINAKSMSGEEALEVLKTILATKNIGLVQHGKIYKVLPLDKIIREGHKVERGRNIADILENSSESDEVVTNVVPLQYGKACILAALFKPLLSEQGQINCDDLNHIIITDYAFNVKKILQILMALDVPLAQEVARIHVLQYVSAQKLEKILNHLFSTSTAGSISALVKIIAVPHAKSLIALAPETVQKRISQIIEKLDTRFLSEEVTIAYEMKFNRADKVAELLTQIFSEAGKEGSGEVAIFYADMVTNTLIVRATQQIYQERIAVLLDKLDILRGDKMESYVYPLANANAENLATILSKVYPNNEYKEKDRNYPIRIVADKTTNSLVICCTVDDYKNIRKTLEEMDKELKQVFVEIVIIEVTLNDTYNLGAEWFYKNSPHFGDEGMVGTFDTMFGLEAAKQSGELDGFRYSITKDKFGAILNMLSRITDINILSAPKLYTTANEPAKITVGEEFPLSTRSQQRKNNSDDTITREFEYREIGLITNVTPFVNDKDEVTLKIMQEISRIDRFLEPPDNNVARIDKRKIDTQVKVKNNETVILGGIFQERERAEIAKVPLIADLPLVGRLFSSEKISKEKIELLVFITPRVIQKPKDATLLMGLSKETLPSESVEKIKWQEEPSKWFRKRRD